MGRSWAFASGLAAALLAVAGLPCAARADVVILKSGGTLEGVVEQGADTVRVEVAYGTVAVPRATVAQIVARPCALQEFRERAARLPAGDAEAAFRLGDFAARAGLPTHARRAFERALAADPDHAGARAQLGYEKAADGRWLTRDEAQRARGLVKLGEEWLAPEEAKLRAALAEQKALEARARIEEARAAAAREEAARRARVEEARLRALEEQYARLAAAREREQDRAVRRAYSRYVPYYEASGYGYGYGYPYYYGYPLIVTYGSHGAASSTANYVRDGSGAFVTVTTSNRGLQTWVEHPGGGVADSVIHADGDGHVVQGSAVNGQPVHSHFPNSSGTGAADIVIRGTNARHP